jgi:serine/threonine protein kinase
MYMFVEYIETGDLMKILNKFTRMTKEMASFYTAQIVVCFEYLHGKDKLFRDLKPENVLVGTDGYVKLADFGFIKNLKAHERTFTFCGTPEYIAPEIISNQGYS